MLVYLLKGHSDWIILSKNKEGLTLFTNRAKVIYLIPEMASRTGPGPVPAPRTQNMDRSQNLDNLQLTFYVNLATKLQLQSRNMPLKSKLWSVIVFT